MDLFYIYQKARAHKCSSLVSDREIYTLTDDGRDIVSTTYIFGDYVVPWRDRLR